jgi:hypothetical protein
MARTRTTPRVKPTPTMIPGITTQPASSAASTTEVTEDLTQNTENENDTNDDSSIKTGNSLKSDTKNPAKQRILEDSDENMSPATEDGEISDDKPVMLEAEEETDEESVNEEVVYLGTSKPPAVTHLPATSNINKNITMTYCIGNVNFGKAYGHFMMLSNGLDQNGSPRHSFRIFLMQIYIQNGKYYMTRFSI